MDLTYFLPVLYAFIASLGFGGLYNLHGRAPLFWAAVGGALGWLAYLITLLAFPDVCQCQRQVRRSGHLI